MAKEYIQGEKEMMETNWAFNMDTACVEAQRSDGSVIAIDTLAVEREFVETWLDRRELDYLIYNDPALFVFSDTLPKTRKGALAWLKH